MQYPCICSTSGKIGCTILYYTEEYTAFLYSDIPWHDIKIDVILAELKLRTLDQNSQGWAVCFAISCRKQKILTALHEHMLLSNVQKHIF